MDHVAIPTSYEPQDSNLPPETRAGVTVPYSATTISKSPTACCITVLSVQSERRRAAGVDPPRWASNLRPPGRSPRALPVCYAADVAHIPENKPTS